MERNVYHVCTSGLAKSLWFLDDEDYVDGMNSIPLCALTAGVSIYCFCLISNHVHFILGGTEDSCIGFIRKYKWRRSSQMSLKYGNEHSISGSDIFIKPIDSQEYLKSAIAYVMRNPMSAGMAVFPNDYRWSSSNLYFADRTLRRRQYRSIGELSLSRKRRMFKSKIILPDDYMIDCEGTIFPGSYVDYRYVEEVYRYPKHFLYYLSSTNDFQQELETGILTKSSYKDNELLASMEGISSDMFRGRRFSALKIEERYLVAREIRKRYGTEAKQLARITSLDYDSLKHMF